MELLTIRHTDFTMSIECGKFEAIWAKAMRHIGEQGLFSTYSWSEGVMAVTRMTEEGEQEIAKGEVAPAVFFENVDYPIWVDFNQEVTEAQFGSELQGDNERFTFRRFLLAGFLNYGNDIGRSELRLVYKIKEETRRFTFTFDVLSTKLDYHTHWRSIMEDIEREYRMLSLAYMRRTFHGFTPDPHGETPEIVWWSLFASEQEKFIKACKNIIERPRHRKELNGLFTWELGKGERSRILFKKDNVELAELIYNPKSEEEENASVGVSDLVVPTVAQKPDILLQLTKNDLHEGMKFTYLFDAKYRIAGRENGVDTPPSDAINRMHRYRDAIYYQRKQSDAEEQSDALKKEVIGGYILFPGDGNSDAVEQAKFHQTIKKVNIGAFPLRPKDKQNRLLLEKFIGELIAHKSQETLSAVIPQKGTFVDVGHRVLIGLVKESSRKDYLPSFKESRAKLYYTGSHFPTTIALQNLHYFMPYFKGEGIRDVYEITQIRTITSKEAKQMEGEAGSDELRLAFDLSFVRQHYPTMQPIDTSRMAHRTFIDTTFGQLDKYLALK